MSDTLFSLPTWQTDSQAAALLAGALENDH